MKFLNLDGLTRFYDRIKEYIDNLYSVFISGNDGEILTSENNKPVWKENILKTDGDGIKALFDDGLYKEVSENAIDILPTFILDEYYCYIPNNFMGSSADPTESVVIEHPTNERFNIIASDKITLIEFNTLTLPIITCIDNNKLMYLKDSSDHKYPIISSTYKLTPYDVDENGGGMTYCSDISFTFVYKNSIITYGAHYTYCTYTENGQAIKGIDMASSLIWSNIVNLSPLSDTEFDISPLIDFKTEYILNSIDGQIANLLINSPSLLSYLLEYIDNSISIKTVCDIIINNNIPIHLYCGIYNRYDNSMYVVYDPIFTFNLMINEYNTGNDYTISYTTNYNDPLLDGTYKLILDRDHITNTPITNIYNIPLILKSANMLMYCNEKVLLIPSIILNDPYNTTSPFDSSDVQVTNLDFYSIFSSTYNRNYEYNYIIPFNQYKQINELLGILSYSGEYISLQKYDTVLYNYDNFEYYSYTFNINNLKLLMYIMPPYYLSELFCKIVLYNEYAYLKTINIDYISDLNARINIYNHLTSRVEDLYRLSLYYLPIYNTVAQVCNIPSVIFDEPYITYGYLTNQNICTDVYEEIMGISVDNLYILPVSYIESNSIEYTDETGIHYSYTDNIFSLHSPIYGNMHMHLIREYDDLYIVGFTVDSSSANIQFVSKQSVPEPGLHNMLYVSDEYRGELLDAIDEDTINAIFNE